MANRGIPTTYNSVKFRSRIEARWAAFFDRVGWPWTYEPFDLDGYIPDFVLEFHKPLLVEVKSDDGEIAMAQSKIECSGWSGEALALSGAWPIDESWGDSMPAFGSLAERVRDPDDDLSFVWGSAMLFECLHCHRISIFHANMLFTCRVNSCYDGDGYLGQVQSLDVRREWALAGNAVQWRAA